MKFQIDTKQLVAGKDKIKKVVLNSSLTKKTIYLKAEPGELILYAYSQGNYGECHIPCAVYEFGFVELLEKSLDRFDDVMGVLTFELIENQLNYNADTVEGSINIVSGEPDFTEREKPSEWLKLPKVIFDVLYCTTKDDNNLCNIFFLGDKIAATSQTAFAGYKHPEKMTDNQFTVPPDFFDLTPKDQDIEVAFDGKTIWLKSGAFYVSASTVDYKNAIVTQYGYHEFEKEDVPFFEITIEEAKRLCSYSSAISELAALVLKDGILTAVPMGSELGVGTMEIKCRSSLGELNFGTSLKNFAAAIEHTDGTTVKAYYVDNIHMLLIDGHFTRHMFGEIPSARYTIPGTSQ